MEHLTVNPDLSGSKRHDKDVKGKIAGIVASLLFVTGCAAPDVGAEKQPHPTPETTSSVEYDPLTLEEARAALEAFTPTTSPVLEDFSLDPNHERASNKAEAYLSLKDSKLAIVNFTHLSKQQAEDFGKTVEQRIEMVTRGTFTVDVDVFTADHTAKQLYKEQRHNGIDPDNYRDYAAVIADITIPELDDSYQSVVALTDGGFNGRSFAYHEGKYADIANVPEDYAAIIENGGNGASDEGFINDPQNSAVHEWLHAVAKLEHSQSAINDQGDLGGTFAGSPERADLAAFLASAQIDPYGGGGIMAATHDIGDDLRPLSVAEIYTTEAAERQLDLATVTKAASLNNETTVTYRPEVKDAIAVFRFHTPITVGDTQSVDRLALTPIREHGMFEGDADFWRVELRAITPDNATVNLATLDISLAVKTLVLPGGQELSIQATDAGNLQITVQ